MWCVERLRVQAGLWGFGSEREENLVLVQRDELNRTYRENLSSSSSQSDTQEAPPTHTHTSHTSHTHTTITTWEAGWNVTNAIQGIFVLGLPYAVLQSGCVGLLVLVLSSVLCCYSGKVLVSCLYEEDQAGQKLRVRHTYADIADACWTRLRPPGLGGKLVNLAQVLELTMTCILYLVVSGNLLGNSFPSLGLSPVTCSGLTFLSLVPCIIIRDLKVVSRLSFLCSVAHVLFTLLVMGYCVCGAPGWVLGGFRWGVEFDGFLEATGVIIFSYTCQIFLPALEGNMQEPAHFGRMMNWTHGLACGLKSSFSLLALLTWGENTKEVVSDNLPSGLRMVVNVCLLVKALLSYPLPFFSAAELLQTGVLGQCAGSAGSGRVSLGVRAGLLLVSLVVAVLVPRWSLLMGLTGSVTGAVMTLLLPSLFHLTLKHPHLSTRDTLLDLLLLSLGSVCSLAGLVRCIRALNT